MGVHVRRIPDSVASEYNWEIIYMCDCMYYHCPALHGLTEQYTCSYDPRNLINISMEMHLTELRLVLGPSTPD